MIPAEHVFGPKNRDARGDRAFRGERVGMIVCVVDMLWLGLFVTVSNSGSWEWDMMGLSGLDVDHQIFLPFHPFHSSIPWGNSIPFHLRLSLSPALIHRAQMPGK